ncbi:hypothetical protein SDC9_170460 [bioreactor metagenome]|uniref:Uncharacterized protein n=1 Tax=bioreactor metagenome TaxID=1076179 RepID=A0A645G8V9_9ZZZZ
MDHKDCSSASLRMDYTFCLFAEHLRFIGCQHVCLLVPVPDEGGVPEHEQNEQQYNTDPHTQYYTLPRG